MGRARGGKGRRSRKSISNRVGKARSVLDSEGKFREESQLRLLAGRFGWREAMEGSNEGFVVGKEEKRATFQMRPEVENSRRGCLEFTVISGVALLA